MENTKSFNADTLAEMIKAVVRARQVTKPIDAIEAVDLVIDRLNSMNLLACPAPETPAASRPRARALTPAVPIEDSVHDEYLICLEDGKRMLMLKRHLQKTYGMTMKEYRAKWGLPADYPSHAAIILRKTAPIDQLRNSQ